MSNHGESAPLVIWITGLPGSGKTTLAASLKLHLASKGLQVIHLDGDQLREAFNAHHILDIDGRKKLANSYQKLTKLINDQGFTVIVSTVSLFSEIFSTNRELFQKYFEIFLNTDQGLLIAGPRKKQYEEKDNVYTKNISPEFPTDSNLILFATKSEDRSKWLNSVILQIDSELGSNE